MDRDRWWQHMFWLFLAAYGVRFLFVLQLQPTPFFGALAGEALFFDRWARHIAAGNWLGYEMAFPSPPFIMYYLGTIYRLLGPYLGTARVVGCVVDSANCVLIAACGQRLFGPRAGLVSGIIWAAYLPALFYEAVMPGTAASVMFFVLAILLFVLSGDRMSPLFALGSGLALGTAAQARPHLVAVMPVLLLWGLWRSRKLSGRMRSVVWAAALAAGLVVVSLVPALRNCVVTGEPGWSVNYGLGFYVGNYYDDPAQILSVTRGSAIGADVVEFTALAGVLAGQQLTPAEASSFWFRRTLDHILDQPASFARKMWHKAADYVSQYELPDDWDYRYLRQRFSVLRLPLLGFGPVFALGTGGFAAALLAGAHEPRSGAWLLAAVIAAYSAGVLLLFYVSRYRLYAMPLLAICAGYLARFGLDAGERRRKDGVIVFAVILLVLVTSALRPNPTNEDGVFATCLVLEGVLHEQYGDVDGALSLYQRSIDLYPHLVTPFVYSGNLAAQREDLELADLWYRRALEVGPLSAHEWHDYAIILRNRGDCQGARDAATNALALDPEATGIQLLVRELRRCPGGD